MEKLDTIFVEFENIKQEQFQRTLFRWIVSLAILQNAGILLISMAPIISFLPESSFFSVVALIFIPVVIARFIPVVGLIQFFRKKKVGWSIMVIFSTMDILQRVPTNLSVFDISGLSLSSQIIMVTLFLLLFISVTLTYLLIRKQIRDMFSISISRLFFAIVIGIVLFVLIQLLLIPLLISSRS